MSTIGPWADCWATPIAVIGEVSPRGASWAWEPVGQNPRRLRASAIATAIQTERLRTVVNLTAAEP